MTTFEAPRVPATQDASLRTLDIGVDLDGCCFDFTASLREWVHRSTGRPLETMPDATCWDFFAQDWRMSLDEFLTHCHAGVDGGHVFAVGDPMPGTVETLHLLRQRGHRLHIVTDRGKMGSPGVAERHTRSWLAAHAVPFDSLTISRDKTCVPVDVFIDDRVENYEVLEAAGVNPYFMHQPWNATHPGRRVAGWSQFAAVVDTLAAPA